MGLGEDRKISSLLIVVGLPVITVDKESKLRKKLADLFFTDFTEYQLDFIWHNDQTSGAAFVQFPDELTATRFLEEKNNFNFFKTCLQIIRFCDYDRIINDPIPQIPTEPPNDEVIDRRHFYDWLLDSRAREQFVVRHGSETQIFWHDPLLNSPQLCYGGEREKAEKKVWTGAEVAWSPMGTWFVTFHKQGVALWGGPLFESKSRYQHLNVQNAELSPNEEYLLTSSVEIRDPNKPPITIFKLHNVICCEVVASYTLWPMSRMFWSPDSQYLAYLSDARTITVLDASTGKAASTPKGEEVLIVAENIQSFLWSPNDNIISLWSQGDANNPSKLILYEVPSLQLLATRTIFFGKDAKMFWQDRGEFLGAVVPKQKQKKKRETAAIEIVALKFENAAIPASTVPVETVDFGETTVHRFHWEGGGSNRFACILEDEDAARGKRVAFYEVIRKKVEKSTKIDVKTNKLTEFGLRNPQMTIFEWAPTGQYFLLAAPKDGELLFCQLGLDNKPDIIHKNEHFRLTDVLWDPTGRYVITAVRVSYDPNFRSSPTAAEAGYKIWTFQGRLRYAATKNELYGVLWRPHPLHAQMMIIAEDVKKRWREYSKRFDQIDDEIMKVQLRKLESEKNEVVKSFDEILLKIEEFKQIRGDETGFNKDMQEYLDTIEYETKKEIVEEIIEDTYENQPSS
eukprot:GHVL01011599.1.p1 GENE.GHVL01011599.1~~GHVL01011599.1.p1  ORF type:complete len:683 (+),score=139.03 GHVL01011599.1:48-2096(+)